MAEAVPAVGERGSAPPDATDSVPSEDYECKICYNYFDLDRHGPKLLSCSHTFCRECLDTLHFREGRGWRIGCPVCRRRTPVPEYRVHNLPDNRALAESLQLKEHGAEDLSDTSVQTGSAVSSATSRESDASCQTCKGVVLVTGCACAILSSLSMVVLLFLGLVFVHNLNNTTWPVGPICLLVASVLALVSLILTWLICTLTYRSETEASNLGSLAINIT